MASLEQTARDWAGVVTDRFKNAGPVYVAFGGLGSRVITHAAGQIIRIWDTRSGAPVSVIETGLPEKRNKNWYIKNRILLSDSGDYALAVNRDGFAPASLWSLADGSLIRRYKFPQVATPSGLLPEPALSDDGTSIYVLDRGDLYRWPGRPVEVP